MKTSNLIRVLTIAACLLFFSTAGYASHYQVHYETLSHDTNVDESGDGYIYKSAYDVDEATVHATVRIEDGDSITWAWAEAYQNRKVYISDYWPSDPTLTAIAVGECTAEIDAYWDTDESEYLSVVEGSVYAVGCGISEARYVQAVVIYTDTADTRSDYFENYTADMSYTGATIYYGHSAQADTYGYNTSGVLSLVGYGTSKTTVTVDES